MAKNFDLYRCRLGILAHVKTETKEGTLKKRLYLFLGTLLLVLLLVGAVGTYLLTNSEVEMVVSNLSNRVAVVVGVDDVLQQTAYDNLFLDPHGDALQIVGESWRGVTEIHQRADPYVHLLALTTSGSWLEANCVQPTHSVGVQFWGDGNDGWATLVVDGEYEWRGNVHEYKEYVEMTDLPLTSHTIRIEAVGEPGTPGGDVHVTLAGISCQQRGPGLSRIQQIFLPLIFQRNE